jgi:TolB protein
MQIMKKQKPLYLSLLLLISLLLAWHSVQAQTNNLRIAFVSNRDGNENIYTMATDGSNQVAITTSEARDWNPRWSPDGSLILFNSNRDGIETLYIMNFDGTNVRRVFVGESFNNYDGAWSPDGREIAFVSNRGGYGRELFLANVDGSNVRQLTDDEKLKGDPVWSPDGTEVAYWELSNEGDILLYRRQVNSELVQSLTLPGSMNGAPLWVGNTIYFDSNREGSWYIYAMGDDGSRVTRLSTIGVNSGRVTIAPDGSKLAFVTDRDSADSDEIYTMNLDGSIPSRLTNNSFSDHSPVWQPAVPTLQIEFPTPTPMLEATEESSGSEAAVGLSVNSVDVFPISKEQLLQDYGILEWHQAGWLGAGQDIGVIDTAFGNLSSFKDLFAFVRIPDGIAESSYSLDNNTHGTDVLEVIHTVAPSANLYACRYDGTLEELEVCADWMLANGVEVINHSVGIPLLPLDGEHEWADLVNRVSSDGALWVNSAGTFNQSFVTDNFDPDSEGYHQWLLPNGSEKPLSIVPESSYSGTILFSWQSSGLITNPETNQLEQIDLDIEIKSAIDGRVLYRGDRVQRYDYDAPLFELVYIDNLNEPFLIDVLNVGAEFQERIEFAIFVEFAAVDEEWLDPNGSVVAPSDAASSLTVGSVNGFRQIASYSSHGAVGTVTLKPDVSAPGEIILADGLPFVGTSAAAPVVSGMAALLLEGVEGMTVARLYNELTNVRITIVTSADRSSYGGAIVFMTAPPATNNVNGRVETPPFTIFPRPDVEFVDNSFRCVTALPSRFEQDIRGYVIYDLGLQIRNGPGEEFTALLTTDNRLEFGTPFTVISGPECNGGSIWWEIELDNGADGWVSEGQSYYLIAPNDLELARLPQVYEIVCPNALDPQLSIGGRGRLIIGNRFFFRGEGATEQMDPLDEGTIVEVLGGPVCEGRASNELRWYIRVISGDSNQIGYEGWLAEGGTESRNIVPIND